MKQSKASQCPLSWGEVFRRNVRKLNNRECQKVAQWLHENDWRNEFDHFGSSWYDPITGVDYGLVGAMQAQAAHEAQAILEARGYVLVSGGTREKMWMYVNEVRKAIGYDEKKRRHIWAPDSKYCSLLAAMRKEGFCE